MGGCQMCDPGNRLLLVPLLCAGCDTSSNEASKKVWVSEAPLPTLSRYVRGTELLSLMKLMFNKGLYRDWGCGRNVELRELRSFGPGS